MSLLRYSDILLPDPDWISDDNVLGHAYRIVAYDSDEVPDRSQAFFVYWRGEVEFEGEFDVHLEGSFGIPPWELLRTVHIGSPASEVTPAVLQYSALQRVQPIIPYVRVRAVKSVDASPKRFRTFVRLCSDAPFRLMPVSL